MSSQQKVFARIIDILEKLKIPYMIGGSVASIAYGEPRMTLDMDLVVDLGEKQAGELAASFGTEYYADLDSMLEAVKMKSHFNIIQSELGVKIDFYILKDDEFSQKEFERRRKEFLDAEKQAIFASPEDIIIKKMEWYKWGESRKHLDDIRGMLKLSEDKLDLNYIEKWAAKLNLQDIWNLVKEQ
jgi:hypothetical protein